MVSVTRLAVRVRPSSAPLSTPARRDMHERNLLNRLSKGMLPWCAGILLAMLVCAGCAGVTPLPPEPAGTTLRADTAGGGSVPVPRIEQAILTPPLLSLAYRINGALRHASVSVEPLPDGPFGSDAKRLPARVMSPATATAGEGRQLAAVPVPVHDREGWLALLNAALAVLTPDTAEYGAAVDILKQDELFLYRGADGELVSVPMIYKPAGIKVQHTYNFNDLLQVILRQIPGAQESAGRRLYETGEDSGYGYPFVYVDVDADLILFLQDPSADPALAQSVPAAGTLKIFLHTVLDHVRGAFSQPVSSVMRLFTLAGGVTADIARPAPLGMLAQRPPPPLSAGAGMDLAEWEAQLDTLTGSAASAGRMGYLIDGAAFFPRLIDRIGTARESVWLRVYIFDNDDYATGIADLLRRRAQDIEVKVLVDGLGTLGAGMASSPSLPRGHVPEPSITRYLEQDSRVKARSVANVWLAGDHTKTIVIDRETAFLGGMNIGREYRYDWHDLMVEVSGPVVGEISASFERAWDDAGWFGDLRRFFARDRAPAVPAGEDDYPVRLLFTRPADAQILRAQIAATRQARHHIYLENPYLTSDEMIYELVKARRRGVDVRVILPYRTDSGLITRSNALAANTMLLHGIRVYIYPGMSHLKAAVYDGWACLGSANLDRLSLRTNREMNLATSHGPAVNALMEQVFEVDMGHALELQEPLPANWSDYLAEMLADYL